MKTMISLSTFTFGLFFVSKQASKIAFAFFLITHYFQMFKFLFHVVIFIACFYYAVFWLIRSLALLKDLLIFVIFVAQIY